MNTKVLDELISVSEKSPQIYQETAYWKSYKKEILKEVKELNINELRSGRYPRFASFGFNEFFAKKRFYHRLKAIVKLVWKYLFLNKPYSVNAPYAITSKDIQNMAYRYCEINGELAKSKHISSIQASRFGNPEDIFEIGGRIYTMSFLNYYIRYCFVQKQISFNGHEIIVELGSGSGHQIEILKKLYPGFTILCFDLPAQIFICEQYLSNVVGKENIVSSKETSKWTDLTQLKKGSIHFFGNWQFPLLKEFKFDLFWNAASFGEMEPEVVKNYLNHVTGNCTWIYLLQSRHGKSRVEKKIRFEDYNTWLKEYNLIKEQDAYKAYKKLVEESTYFEALWKHGQ